MLPPGTDPNQPPVDPNNPTGQKPKAGGGKITDTVYLASEMGEIKGKMNLLIELMQGQMGLGGSGTKAASEKVSVSRAEMHALLELLKAE